MPFSRSPSSAPMANIFMKRGEVSRFHRAPVGAADQRREDLFGARFFGLAGAGRQVKIRLRLSVSPGPAELNGRPMRRWKSTTARLALGEQQRRGEGPCHDAGRGLHRFAEERSAQGMHAGFERNANFVVAGVLGLFRRIDIDVQEFQLLGIDADIQPGRRQRRIGVAANADQYGVLGVHGEVAMNCSESAAYVQRQFVIAAGARLRCVVYFSMAGLSFTVPTAKAICGARWPRYFSISSGETESTSPMLSSS